MTGALRRSASLSVLAAFRVAFGVAIGVAIGACAAQPSVDRVYGGEVVRGRFVEPEAYATFLRGAIAEAAGKTQDAITEYERAARLDPRSPEIWTRIGALQCPSETADASFRRALDLDRGSARAWAAMAACATARGRSAEAQSDAEHAASLDTAARGEGALRSAAAAGIIVPALRDRLLALTLSSHDPRVAWTALASFSETHGDVALWARALRETVKLDPGRRVSVARASEQLAAIGWLAEARTVAAAAADVDPRPLSGSDLSLAARLAVDDAIAKGDVEAVRRRATRVRLELDEAAGRALLTQDARLARALVSVVARADPTARGARLVLAAAGEVGVSADAQTGDAPSASAALVAYGAAVVRATPERARAILSALRPGEIVAGDDLVVRRAVELVSRDALDAALLPPDGAAELAAIRGETPPVDPGIAGLDARHEYLVLALSRPADPRTLELGVRLEGALSSDRVVAAADAFARLGRGTPALDASAASQLLARDASDPLLAAAALRVAEKTGDAEAARRARIALAGLRDTHGRTLY
jgi:tetratricopeptide (TPR) repeat protein